jgi:nitrous oxidase accessory protein NosD
MTKSKDIIKKTVVLLVILMLFITMISFSSVAQRDSLRSVQNNSNVKNGSKGYIQNMIDAASPGDTINIPAGTYYENLVIDKTVNLIGEDKETTIIDGFWSDTVITIIPGPFYDVTITGFTIRNSDFPGGIGVLLPETCSGHNIIGNIISGHHGSAIDIDFFASNNVVSENILLNNGIGITTGSNTMQNIIYHNNFIDNGQNAYDGSWIGNTWNLGYGTPFNPLTDGGNYWSDYTGVDNYHGPNQNILGSDGIGDTPYSIPGGSTDQYPFMEPWTGIIPDTTPPEISHEPVSYAVYNEDFEINAQIIDDVSNAESITAYIEYRHPSNSPSVNSLKTIEMEYINYAFFKGVVKRAIINKLFWSANPYSTVLLFYRIRAIDEAGNEQVTEFYNVKIVKL